MTDGDRRKQIAFRTEETGKRDGWKSGTGAARHFMLLRFGTESGDTRTLSFYHVNMLLHWYVLQWEDDSNTLNKKRSTPQWISWHLWPLLMNSREDGVQQTWPHASSYKRHITEESTVFWTQTPLRESDLTDPDTSACRERGRENVGGPLLSGHYCSHVRLFQRHVTAQVGALL